MAITVYTKPHCPQCDSTKRFLDRLGATYETRAISDNPSIVTQAKERGIMSAPIVVAGEVMFGGFNPDKLREISERCATDDDTWE